MWTCGRGKDGETALQPHSHYWMCKIKKVIKDFLCQQCPQVAHRGIFLFFHLQPFKHGMTTALLPFSLLIKRNPRDTEADALYMTGLIYRQTLLLRCPLLNRLHADTVNHSMDGRYKLVPQPFLFFLLLPKCYTWPLPWLAIITHMNQRH